MMMMMTMMMIMAVFAFNDKVPFRTVPNSSSHNCSDPNSRFKPRESQAIQVNPDDTFNDTSLDLFVRKFHDDDEAKR